MKAFMFSLVVSDMRLFKIGAESKADAISKISELLNSNTMFQDLVSMTNLYDSKKESYAEIVWETKEDVNKTIYKVPTMELPLTSETLEDSCRIYAKKFPTKKGIVEFSKKYNIAIAEDGKCIDCSDNFELLKCCINSMKESHKENHYSSLRVVVEGGTDKALRVFNQSTKEDVNEIRYDIGLRFWIPKKLVSNWRKDNKSKWSVEIPYWFFDKKMDECLEKKTQYLYTPKN